MKKLFAAVFGLLALLVVAVLMAPMFITPDAIKAELVQLVESSTGRRLTIEGKLSITLFPNTSVTVEKVALSNPSDFEDPKAFITLDSLRVDVDLMPLLSKKVVIKQFVLDGPNINLHQAKGGGFNWSLKKPKPPQVFPAKPIEVKAPNAPSKGIADHIMLSNFEIRNGTLTYVNDIKSTRTEIKKLNLSTKITSSAMAVQIDGSGEWMGKAISVKAGLGTLQSLLDEQKADFNLALESGLFSINTDGNYKGGNTTGKSTIKVSSLKELATWLNPEDKALATPAKLAFLGESDIRCGNSYCNFPNIRMVLDSIEAKGSIKINTSAAKPQLDITLNTGALDFNPFLPQPQNASSNPIVADAYAEGERWSSAPIDLSGMKSFNVNATINAESILYKKLKIGKSVLSAKLTDGKFSATIPDAKMYGGTGTINIVADSNTSPPTFENHSSFKGIDIEALLKDASEFDRVTGTGDFQMNTTGRGHSQREIISSLSGDGKLQLSNGTIKRVRLQDMLRNVQTAFTDANAQSQQTNYTQMGGTFTIAQGTVTNRDLLMQMEGMNVNGEGTIELPAYHINYRLTPKLVRTVQDQTTGTAAEKAGISVPVIVEGDLDQPKFRPDLAALVNEALQDPKKLKEELKNSKGLIKDQLKDPKAAIKNLKGLLGR